MNYFNYFPGKTVLYEVFMNITATSGDDLNVPHLPQGLILNDLIIYSCHNSRNHLQTLKALTENLEHFVSTAGSPRQASGCT